MPFFALWARKEGGVPIEAAALLAGAVAVAFLLPETLVSETLVPGERPAEGDEDEVAAVFAAFQDRQLAALLLPVAAIGIAASWIETVLPLFAVDGGSLTPAGVGLLFTYAASLGMVFQMPLTRASAHVPPDRLMLGGGAALAAAFAALLASSHPWPLILAVSLSTLAEMLTGPVTQAISSGLAPAHARARYMAAYSAVHDLRDAAGSALGTAFYAVSAGLPWLVGVPVTLLATAVLARTARTAPGAQARHPASDT